MSCACTLVHISCVAASTADAAAAATTEMAHLLLNSSVATLSMIAQSVCMPVSPFSYMPLT